MKAMNIIQMVELFFLLFTREYGGLSRLLVYIHTSWSYKNDKPSLATRHNTIAALFFYLLCQQLVPLLRGIPNQKER